MLLLANSPNAVCLNSYAAVYKVISGVSVKITAFDVKLCNLIECAGIEYPSVYSAAEITAVYVDDRCGVGVGLVVVVL